jgi:hypothetical protein
MGNIIDTMRSLCNDTRKLSPAEYIELKRCLDDDRSASARDALIAAVDDYLRAECDYADAAHDQSSASSAHNAAATVCRNAFCEFSRANTEYISQYDARSPQDIAKRLQRVQTANENYQALVVAENDAKEALKKCQEVLEAKLTARKQTRTALARVRIEMEHAQTVI